MQGNQPPLLNKEENFAAAEKLDPEKPAVIFSHFQLVKDDTLNDKNKAISAAEQSTWRPSIVFNQIKKHLIEVGEDYNMTFEEQ